MSNTTPLDAEQLAAYFALMEVSNLLRYAVEQQLRADGDLSYVQFEILSQLRRAPDGQQRMTDLADQVVYSRSGLTYQVGQLEKAGLVTRAPSVDDERSTTVTITAKGQALLQRVLPGHIALVRQMLLPPLNHRDITTLTRILDRVRSHMRGAPPRSAAPRPHRKLAQAEHGEG